MKKIFIIIISLFLFISCGPDQQGAIPAAWILIGFIITIPLILWMMNHDKGEKHKDNPKMWISEQSGQVDFWTTILIYKGNKFGFN